MLKKLIICILIVISSLIKKRTSRKWDLSIDSTKTNINNYNINSSNNDDTNNDSTKTNINNYTINSTNNDDINNDSTKTNINNYTINSSNNDDTNNDSTKTNINNYTINSTNNDDTNNYTIKNDETNNDTKNDDKNNDFSILDDLKKNPIETKNILKIPSFDDKKKYLEQEQEVILNNILYIKLVILLNLQNNFNNKYNYFDDDLNQLISKLNVVKYNFKNFDSGNNIFNRLNKKGLDKRLKNKLDTNKSSLEKEMNNYNNNYNYNNKKLEEMKNKFKFPFQFEDKLLYKYDHIISSTINKEEIRAYIIEAKKYWSILYYMKYIILIKEINNRLLKLEGDEKNYYQKEKKHLLENFHKSLSTENDNIKEIIEIESQNIN